MSGWRTAWRSLARAINCPECGDLQTPGEKCQNTECGADIRKVKSSTHGLRFHDLRHHAITELAESQASDQTIITIAGHVSREMLERYSHIRMDAKRKALGALSGGGSPNTSALSLKIRIRAMKFGRLRWLATNAHVLRQADSLWELSAEAVATWGAL